MLFSQVIGQKETKEQLVHMVQQNRLSHALLFLGKEGFGALPLAFAMAQYLVCEKVNGKLAPAAEANEAASLFEPSLFGDAAPAIAPAETASPQATNMKDACGQCPACQKAMQMVHPDIHFSYPVVSKKAGEQPISADYITEWRKYMGKNRYANAYDWLQYIEAENKQGNITSRECAEIIKKLSLKSFEAGYKILIMWMPELLGNQGNKLLKLIEEPPQDTLFLLVAENEGLILPTILSRTQLVRLPPLSQQDIKAALEMEEGVPMNRAAQIAAVSDGNYHEALQQLAHSDEDWEVLLRDWLNAILKTGPVAQVKWIDDISKIGREKQKQFLMYFIHILQVAVEIGTQRETSGERSTLHDFAARFNKLCSIEQQEAIVNELDQAIYYIERNAHAKLLFHALSIKLYHIISNKSVILVQ
ncbi:MAG: DNA polymerase III subunit delta' [Chitinophagaceae bacterium]|nr:MAG: DNA polymerase III subunit delta' [Chitinophagaceae bacterium]